jgi:hypothetical protein
MKRKKLAPNLKAFYDQSKAHISLLANATCENEETATEIRKMLSQPDPLLKDAEDAAACGDVDMLLCLLDNTSELAFVSDNIAWLKSLGKYEKALLNAYIDTRTNYSRWQLSVLKLLFNMADRPTLLAAGDPLPGNEPFTVFRGVAGRGSKRRLRGISWTADREKAIWFAKRFVEMGLVQPAVYQAVIPIANVYAYHNGRNEQEFLCDIDNGCHLKKVWAE